MKLSAMVLDDTKANAPLEFHPAANIFPLIEGREFDDLVADIRANGLRLPIILHADGRILDGRNRYRACIESGVEPRFDKWDGVGLAADLVWSLNDKRRHLEKGQREMAAGRYAIEREAEARERQIATLKVGAAPSSQICNDGGESGRSVEKAAEKFGISERTVSSAVKVAKEGAPELVKAVESGNVSVSAAADVATLPQDEQRRLVALADPKMILDAAKVIRAEKVDAKRAQKVAATLVIAANNKALPAGERKYSAIYADPPWSFDVWSGAGKDRAAENHYPTMTQEEIEALPVASLAADDCALFLWAVMPQLPEALAVIKAWGFEYKTCAFVWVKTTQDGERPATGMGYWTRANAEICLLATKGSPPRLNADVHQIVQTPRMEHSRKPEEVAARIMRLIPGPYLEMFSRGGTRDGWDLWGNQAEAA